MKKLFKILYDMIFSGTPKVGEIYIARDSCPWNNGSLVKIIKAECGWVMYGFLNGSGDHYSEKMSSFCRTFTRYFGGG